MQDQDGQNNIISNAWFSQSKVLGHYKDTLQTINHIHNSDSFIQDNYFQVNCLKHNTDWETCYLHAHSWNVIDIVQANAFYVRQENTVCKYIQNNLHFH